MYASGTGYSSENNNNAAIYTKEGGSWSNKTADKKIMLSNNDATIYAIYPSKNGESDWTVTDLSSTPTISIKVFQKDDATADNHTITVPAPVPAAGSPAEILSAPGEIDYMYGVDNDNDTQLATASNKEGKSAVKLKMKHALAMVSFRIYNDGTYSGDGHLTEIKLSNVASGTNLNAGSDPKMKISDGKITAGVGSAATYTRVIKTATNTDYYELGKVTNTTADDTGGKNEIKAAAAKFSILVFPILSTSSVKASTIQVTFKIDGVEHTVPLATDQTDVNFAAGTNSLYTAVLSGKGLSILSLIHI